jgi:hypothetical protein
VRLVFCFGATIVEKAHKGAKTVSTAYIGVLICVFVFLGFSFLLGRLSWHRRVARDEDKRSWWADWQQGMSTEMTGALVATVLFGLALGYLEERDTKETLQREYTRARLIYDMGSLDNSEARHAVERLRAQGWLTNRTLKDEVFIRANLRDAGLQAAYLRGASFENATLTGADLTGANLLGTIFTGADLSHAQLAGAFYDEKTVLPDGTFWTPDTDLARFTDPAHPDFWRSNDPLSPAYRGDSEPDGE